MKFFFNTILFSTIFSINIAFANIDSVNVVQVVANSATTSTTTTSTSSNIFLNNTGGLAFILDPDAYETRYKIPIGYFSIEEGRFIFYSQESGKPVLKPEVLQRIEENFEENTIFNEENFENFEESKEDVCTNLEGRQLSLPAGWMVKDGNCFAIVEISDFLTENEIQRFTQFGGLKLIEYVGFSGILSSAQILYILGIFAAFLFLIFMLLKILLRL
jgi:hypothetical protein